MKRIKLTIQYVGTNYAGWQVQPKQNTIESKVEEAVFLAFNEKTTIYASGRTDAGVHAFMQVAHFDTNTKTSPEKISFCLNKFLPEDIRVLKSEEVSSDFHARFSAKRKTYEYNFYISKTNLPLLDLCYAKVAFDFDYARALSCIKSFVGTHDFKAFCSSKTVTKDTIRTIYDIKLTQKQKNVFGIEICGNGFLYNMVRIIAGTIIEVGCGKKEPQDIAKIIKSKDRNLAGKTMPANGLVLKNVEYLD